MIITIIITQMFTLVFKNLITGYFEVFKALQKMMLYLKLIIVFVTSGLIYFEHLMAPITNR